ncbi:hypothetical protein DLAC_07809 [Tieghemostelium lacteum]|uniref:Uncharacterized protein n=1 Tax=Tieghemostelium lacteum TaxID=361077 RepID=A0A151ZAG4_TIELA|nr:hypothetical protein DLAC_07809 [Tieghemostelium lacteum]|eukprot:KYQ90933.1 hypothetical protein DLAC_07809 [Tieghemostelium lacteum]
MVIAKKSPVEGFHSWIGVLVEPSKPIESDGKLPNYHLEVDHVFGYNEKEVYYLNEKEIIYSTGSVGVIQSIETRSQKYLLGHTNDVTSLALNKEKTLAATGQVGAEVLVIVWDLKTLTAKTTIKVGKYQGIASLSFSPDSSKLVGVCTDVHKTLFIWDLKKDGKDPLTSQFSFPIEHVHFNQDKNHLVIYGEKNISFLNVSKDAQNPNSLPQVNKKTGLMGSLSKQPSIQSVLSINQDFTVFGTADGRLLLFNGVNIVKELHVPSPTTKPSPIKALVKYQNDSAFIVVSDNKVLLYQLGKDIAVDDVKATEIYQIESPTPIIPISFDINGDNLVLGTTSSDIYMVDLKDQKSQQFLSRAHDDEVVSCWALGTADNTFVTGSTDKSVQVWSVSQKKQLLELQYKSAVTCVTASNSKGSPSQLLAIGLQDGTLIFYDLTTNKEIQQVNVDTVALRLVRFSPCDKYLSVCLTNGNIQNYLVEPNNIGLRLQSTCKGSSAHIAFLDYSADSKTLQTNSGAYEILYWDVQSGDQIKSASQVKDYVWFTWTCLLGYYVKGIWSKGQDGSDINCLSRSSNTTPQLLATGDDSNNVNLFKFPASHDHSQKKVYSGYHASHVLSCTFSQDSKYLISCGGDKSIFIWKVIQD